MSANPFHQGVSPEGIAAMEAARLRNAAAPIVPVDDGGLSGLHAYEVVRDEQRLGGRLDEMDPIIVRLARKYARAHGLNFRRSAR